MSTETANLIVACASLMVMVVTFVVACETLRFMVKNSKGYLRRKLREVSTECSHRYSPLQRGGCDDYTNPDRQPVRLQHIHIVPCVVAALQAAHDGIRPGNHRVLPWAISVAALQAAPINQNLIVI